MFVLFFKILILFSRYPVTSIITLQLYNFVKKIIVNTKSNCVKVKPVNQTRIIRKVLKYHNGMNWNQYF